MSGLRELLKEQRNLRELSEHTEARLGELRHAIRAVCKHPPGKIERKFYPRDEPLAMDENVVQCTQCGAVVDSYSSDRHGRKYTHTKGFYK